MERKLTWIHSSCHQGNGQNKNNARTEFPPNYVDLMRGVLDGYKTDAEQQGNAPLDRRK
jgi:hypothetical protein